MMVPLWRRLILLARPHATVLLIVTGSLAMLQMVMLRGRGEAWLDLVGASLNLLSGAFAIILTSGIVSRDLTRGMMPVWLQKPVDPVRFYLARMAEAVVAWTLLSLAAILATRGVTGWLGWSAPVELTTAIPRIWLTSLAISAIAFGVSPWLPKGGTVTAVAVALAGIVIEQDLAIRGAEIGTVWPVLLRLVILPSTALESVAAFVAGRSDAIWGPLAHIALYVAAWVAFGALGVRTAVVHGWAARAQD